MVTGPDAKRTVAEMVAGLYDASLDAYRPHQWMESFAVFRRETSRVQTQFENQRQPLQQILYGWYAEPKDAKFTYRAFYPEISTGRRDMPRATYAPRQQLLCPPEVRPHVLPPHRRQ